MNTIVSEVSLSGSTSPLTISPLLITAMAAVVLHTGLLLVHFKPSEQPYYEPNLDITLVQQNTTTVVTQEAIQEWQPDLTPLRQPEPQPIPITSTATQVQKVTTVAEVKVPEETPSKPIISASALRQASLNAARELPEIMLAPETIRRKYVSANTQEWKYLSYMRAWTDKVERVGNLNYPEQARREGLHGSLVLSVGVLPDGTLESIEVLRSSGFDMLDEAAMNIVRLSAPFAALPEEITLETDILYITRTWRFTPDEGLTNN